MKKKSEIEKLLFEYPQYRDALYCRGYLITEGDVNGEAYPFYGQWKRKEICGYKVLLHPYLDNAYFEQDHISYLLLGHIYNPFAGISDEQRLLADCHQAYKKGKKALADCVYEWTGVFALYIFDDNITVIQDCAGYKGVYYGTVMGKCVFTDHPQLAGDLYGLNIDRFIQKLIRNRFYNIGNRYLPGDMSIFRELKRSGANVFLEYKNNNFTIKRFYPIRCHEEAATQEDYERAITKAGEVLHNSIALILEKWDNVSVSLTGGTDSKTTLASANGYYDKLGYFSFISKEAEGIDARAAHDICCRLGLEHRMHSIPDDNSEIEDFEVLKAIMEHSIGYIMNLPDYETRKYIYLYRLNAFTTEIKSQISEIVRVFFERKYGMQMPEEFAPRHCSILQTRYFLSPGLLRKSDKAYKEFMEKFDFGRQKYNYETADLYYWEVRMANWGMLVNTSLDLCHRLTYPFNNRRLIDIFLSIPREIRIKDEAHNDIIKMFNKEIYDMKISVHNEYHNRRRVFMERLYFKYRTMLQRFR